MNSAEDKVDTYQIDTYNTTNTINLFLKGSNTKMSVYVLLYEIEWHKAKKFSKSQSFAVFGLKIYAKRATSSRPPLPEDLA